MFIIIILPTCRYESQTVCKNDLAVFVVDMDVPPVLIPANLPFVGEFQASQAHVDLDGFPSQLRKGVLSIG